MSTVNSIATASFSAAQKKLCLFGAMMAACALTANVTDIALGFGDTEVASYGGKTAVEWFAVFQANWFKGLYVLGILNIVYQLSLIPVFYCLYILHKQEMNHLPALALLTALIGVSVYISHNAAIPMYSLSNQYAAATSEDARLIIAGAGQAVLATGEDFTPGSFMGLILSSIAAVLFAVVQLRGGLFGKPTALTGIVGFIFLSLFVVIATFIQSLYVIAFYSFAMFGGLCALAWFALTGFRLLKFSLAG